MSGIASMSMGVAPGGAAVARVEGEIDLASASAIGAELASACADGALAVDMSDVRFIDSAGVRMLVDLAREVAGERTPPLTLVAPSGSAVRRMLELTGIEPLFTVVEAAGDLGTAS